MQKPLLWTWFEIELLEQLEKVLVPLDWMNEHMMGPLPLQLAQLLESCPADRLWPISWAVRR